MRKRLLAVLLIVSLAISNTGIVYATENKDKEEFINEELGSLDTEDSTDLQRSYEMEEESYKTEKSISYSSDVEAEDMVIEYNGHKYQYFEEGISWYEAEERCENLGGYLVTITSEEEQKTINNFVSDLKSRGLLTKQDIWVGAKRVDDKFIWITNELFDFMNWSSGEPNNVYNQQDCMMMYTDLSINGELGKWNDENGNGRDWPGYQLSDIGYICEWGDYNIAPTPPIDYSEYNGHKYKYYDDQLSWNEAQEKCEDLGGYLVCISDQNENEFIRTLCNGKEGWIGGNDLVEKGRWEWVSGEEFVYSNWLPGEPNNNGGMEDFILIKYDGRWNDGYLNTGFGFICEWGDTASDEMNDLQSGEEISDHDLFTKYPNYLKNPLNLQIENFLGDNIETALSKVENKNIWNDFWASFRYTFKEGGMSILLRETFKFLGVDDTDTYDKYLDASTMDFIKAVSEDENLIMDMADKSFEFFSEYKPILEMGENFDKHIASYVIALAENIPASEAMKLISECDKRWLKISGWLEAAGRVADYGQVLVTTIKLMTINKNLVEKLLQQVSPNSSLAEGLNRIKTKINKNPVGFIVENILKDECLSLIVDAMDEGFINAMTLFAFGQTVTSPAVFFGDLTIKAISYLPGLFGIPVSTEVVKSINQHSFTNVLRQSLMDNLRIKFINYNINENYPNNIQKEIDEYEMYYNIYLKAVQLDIDTAKKVAKSGRSKTLLEDAQRVLDEYNYEKYIELCKRSIKNELLGTGLRFTVNRDGTANITGFAKENTSVERGIGKNTIPKDLVIPAKIQGHIISKIENNAFKGDNEINRVIFEPGTIKIGNNAFADCINLKELYTSKTINEVGEEAFKNCSNLSVIQLEENVSEISREAFAGCTAIKTLSIPASVKFIDDKAFCNNTIETVHITGSKTGISQTAFENTPIVSISGVKTSPAEDIASEIGAEFVTEEPQVTTIIINALPSKLVYTIQEELCTDNLELEIQYEDGSSEIATSGWSVLFNNKHLGKNEVTVFYKNETAKYDVEIIPSTVQYTVNYVNQNGFSIAESTVKNGIIGERIKESAISIEDYLPDVDQVEQILDQEDNSVIIKYHKKEKLDISNWKIEDLPIMKFNGQEIKPNVIIRDSEGKQLYIDKDYLLLYKNNINPGTATINILGIGNWKGTLTKEFYIECFNYNISFETKGGSLIEDQIVSQDKKIVKPGDPIKAGYHFNSWYKEKECIVEWDFDTIITKDLTLYAKWEPIKYSVNYNLYGGTGAVNPTTYTIETEAFSLKSPSRKGYSFAGWYSDLSYRQKVDMISKGTTGNKTLYAKWLPIAYGITYNLNKGKNSNSNPGSFTIETNIELKNPIRKGYMFSGWYSDSNYKNKVVKIPQGSIGNKMLFAKWSKVSVKKVSLSKILNVKNKQLKVIFKRLSGVKGYQVQYSTSKKFTKKYTKSVTVKQSSKKTLSKIIKKLKKNKTYHVRVRAYKVDSCKNNVYGKWSKVKKIKITR